MSRREHDETYTNDSGRDATGLKLDLRQGCTPKKSANGRYGGAFVNSHGSDGASSHEFSDGTVKAGESITITFATTANNFRTRRVTWVP
ncbi:MAG: hypothetical protein Tsb002_35940 [Wenzhouxiangellaceae bacterium]